MNARWWPEDRIAKLKELHASGMSFGLIARELGCARNAAIGKAHRLGLAGRVQAPSPLKGLKRGRPQSASSALRFERVRAIRKRPVDDLPKVPTPETAVRFMDLAPHHCRWPVKGEGLGIMFCGSAITDQSYCAYHDAMGHSSRESRAAERRNYEAIQRDRKAQRRAA